VLARRRLRASRSQVVEVTKAARSKRIELETLLSDWVLAATLVKEDLEGQYHLQHSHNQARKQQQGSRSATSHQPFDMHRRINNIHEAILNSSGGTTASQNPTTRNAHLNDLFAPFRRRHQADDIYEEDLLDAPNNSSRTNEDILMPMDADMELEMQIQLSLLADMQSRVSAATGAVSVSVCAVIRPQ
jgi:hypothetical protein